jgi:hypothetical protein
VESNETLVVVFGVINISGVSCLPVVGLDMVALIVLVEAFGNFFSDFPHQRVGSVVDCALLRGKSKF